MVLTETKVSRNASVVQTEEQLDVVFETLPRTLHRSELGSLAAASSRFLQHQTKTLGEAGLGNHHAQGGLY